MLRVAEFWVWFFSLRPSKDKARIARGLGFASEALDLDFVWSCCPPGWPCPRCDNIGKASWLRCLYSQLCLRDLSQKLQQLQHESSFETNCRTVVQEFLTHPQTLYHKGKKFCYLKYTIAGTGCPSFLSIRRSEWESGVHSITAAGSLPAPP